MPLSVNTTGFQRVRTKPVGASFGTVRAPASFMRRRVSMAASDEGVPRDHALDRGVGISAGFTRVDEGPSDRGVQAHLVVVMARP